MQPIFFTWLNVDVVGRDGEIKKTWGMFPFTRQMNIAQSQFDEGGQYQLEVAAAKGERSDAAHKRYMASVVEAWRNLPEDLARDFPSPDHLRKRALIVTGFFHENMIVFDSNRDAARHAAYCKPMDPFAVVDVKGNVVRHFRAKSQKYLRSGGMAKEEFNESADKVLALLADEIDVKRAVLRREGEKP